MRMVLFDLGGTLEDEGVLRPGAREALAALTGLRAGGRPAVLLGLLSDFDMPADPADAAEVAGIRGRYLALLDELGIREFFVPDDRRVTLSTEVGVVKPAPATFRAAVAKADPTLTFGDVVFVTENAGHIRAARRLGLQAVRVQGTGEPSVPPSQVPAGELPDEIAGPADLVPVVRGLLGLPAAEPEAVERAGPGRGAWTRIGDDLVVVGGAPHVRAGRIPPAGAAASPAGAEAAAPAGSTAARVHTGGERLHLVVQNGRLFQAEHPEVPVLVDRGRHLVVDLDSATAYRDCGVCWTLLPLPVDAVVRSARRADPDAEPDPDVLTRFETLTRDGFLADLTTLAAYPTRRSDSDGFDDAARWAAQQLEQAGFAVRTQDVPRGGPRCRNVIGERPGAGPEPRDVVLVTAHLDSINLTGPAEPAPGADDNASGSAGVLALARALGDLPAAHDLRMILFGGEEEGLFGSLRHVASLSGDERARIRAVLNMDMIGCQNTPVPGVLLEGAAVSDDVLDALARAAATYTDLAVEISHTPYNSDHVPFIDAGIPAVLTIEGADGANDRVHTERDVVESVEPDLAMEILRMNLAYLIETLGRAAPPA
jgi:FMN phosphatase YigB (HAD superfamily)